MIDTRGLHHKCFYWHIYFRSAISKCLCYWQSLLTGFNKHASFLCYIINYGCNKMLAPGANVIKHLSVIHVTLEQVT